MEGVMKRIKEERVKRGLNQTAIARYLNISQSTYSKIEKGSQKLLAEDLVKLAFFFDMSIDDFWR
jgi:transcriptional regulator with XRE-family HTH domain